MNLHCCVRVSFLGDWRCGFRWFGLWRSFKTCYLLHSRLWRRPGVWRWPMDADGLTMPCALQRSIPSETALTIDKRTFCLSFLRACAGCAASRGWWTHWRHHHPSGSFSRMKVRKIWKVWKDGPDGTCFYSSYEVLSEFEYFYVVFLSMFIFRCYHMFNIHTPSWIIYVFCLDFWCGIGIVENSVLPRRCWGQCQDLQDCGKVAVGGSSWVSFDFKWTLRYLSTLRVVWSLGVILMVLGVYWYCQLYVNEFAYDLPFCVLSSLSSRS